MKLSGLDKGKKHYKMLLFKLLITRQILGKYSGNTRLTMRVNYVPNLLYSHSALDPKLLVAILLHELYSGNISYKDQQCYQTLLSSTSHLSMTPTIVQE
jgi:hypothetical protein